MSTDASRVQMLMLTEGGICSTGNPEPEWSGESRPVTRAARALRFDGVGAMAEPPHHGHGRAPRQRAMVIELLRRPHGASVSEIAAAVGWEPARVRALLSDPDLPVVIEELPDAERRYHIAALVEPHCASSANLIAR